MTDYEEVETGWFWCERDEVARSFDVCETGHPLHRPLYYKRPKKKKCMDWIEVTRVYHLEGTFGSVAGTIRCQEDEGHDGWHESTIDGKGIWWE